MSENGEIPKSLREFRYTFHLQIKTHSRNLCRFLRASPVSLRHSRIRYHCTTAITIGSAALFPASRIYYDIRSNPVVSVAVSAYLRVYKRARAQDMTNCNDSDDRFYAEAQKIAITKKKENTIAQARERKREQYAQKREIASPISRVYLPSTHKWKLDHRVTHTQRARDSLHAYTFINIYTCIDTEFTIPSRLAGIVFRDDIL